MRRLRLGDLRRLLADRCRGRILPDDDAGREYLLELLLPISLGPNEAVKRPGAIQIWGPTDRMRREIELWAPWMSEDDARELRLEINSMPMWQRKPRAMTLGERLRVTYGERARLQLRTIGPCDMTEAAMALMRKQKKRQQDRLRRQLQGQQSRADYLAAHNKSKEQPWLALGISRATWYRQIKQEQASETSPRHINLNKTGLALVSKEELGSRAGECVRIASLAATPAGLTDTSVNAYGAKLYTEVLSIEEYASLLGHWVPVNEMDWIGWTPELAAEVAKGADAICPPECPPDLEAAA
jgi:hypothetical protein